MEGLIWLSALAVGLFVWWCPIFKPYWGFWKHDDPEDTEDNFPNGF